jgi:lipopolysaccharide export system permease protein
MPVTLRKRCAMPMLWQHIMKEYLKALGIALFGISTLLLSTKLEEIARFISLGASFLKIFYFVILQIPYILQIALPLSSLVAGFMVFSQLSTSGELTAMRAAGYSLKTILTPVALLSALLGVFTMGAIFDLCAKSHFAAKKLEFDIRDEEPLAFVQNSHFFAKHGVALELKGSLHTQKKAKDLLFCIPTAGDRLSLIVMETAHAAPKILTGNGFTLISSKAPTSKDVFGSLLIENAEEKRTPTDCVHELAQKRTWKPLPDNFSLSVIRSVKALLQKQISAAQYQGKSTKKLSLLLNKFTAEPYRRLSLSFAIFSLTLVGSICAIKVGRSSNRIMKISGPIIGFIFFIACYLAGKNLDAIAPLAIVCFFLPHPILLMAVRSLAHRIEHGVEL